MLNSSSGAGFSFKPADSIKHDSILDKLDKSGSKFSKPYQKPNKNSATDKLVNSDAGSGFRPAEKLKQGSVMDMLGGSGFKPAEKLKSGSVMDVLGNNSNAGYSFKPADQLKQGSVMDILGSSGSGFKPASELKQGSVMDILGGKSMTGFSPFSVTACLPTFSLSIHESVKSFCLSFLWVCVLLVSVFLDCKILCIPKWSKCTNSCSKQVVSVTEIENNWSKILYQATRSLYCFAKSEERFSHNKIDTTSWQYCSCMFLLLC